MRNSPQKSSVDKGDNYKIAVIGDTSSGKTMLLLGLILTSKNGLLERLTVVSSDVHQDEIIEMRKHLQKGIMPAGTSILTTYTLALQWMRLGICGWKTVAYPLVFRDYKGGDIKDGISFFDQKFGDCDGVLFLMNPGQPVLNLGKTEDADDAALSMQTNLINGISGSVGDRKRRATAMAAAVTAMDRIRKGGDLYAHRSKFFDAFNRYIVNPLKTNASGIACKTDFKISVTGHVESQEKIKRIDPRNNAAAPFLWLIDRIDRRKHPVRYWTRRLWPVFLLALLAAIGCMTWMWQHNRVEGINKEGERIFNKAQTEFKETQVTHSGYSKHERFLGTSVTNLHTLFTPFPDVREKSNVAYTNLLTKYLIVAADAAYLKKKDDIKNSKQKPESDQAYALRRSACEIETPSAFIEYKAVGRSNEVELAEKRLREHHEKKVPEVVSEYNEKYFDARFDMLETNAAQVASQKYIYGLTNELAVWKQECSIIPTWSNHIEHIISRMVARCPAWRAAFASNIVQNVESFEYKITGRAEEIFQFEKRKLGRELHECLTAEEPAAQEALYEAKKGLLDVCCRRYFELKKFGKDAEEYPSDDKLSDNLKRLLRDTTLTNCVGEWKSTLHNRQRDWLWAESGKVKDEIQKAKDSSAFLVRPRKGIGARVHAFLVCVAKWAQEEKDVNKQNSFDEDCRKVWEQFRERYFADTKWKLGNDYDYPNAEANVEEKIFDFLKETRITNIQHEYDKWVSVTRSKQKEWLIGAMKRCEEEFNGFDPDDNNSNEIRSVLEASQLFVTKMVSGNIEDRNWVTAVEAARKSFVEKIKDKYFDNKKFKSNYPFPPQDGKDWVSFYEKAGEESDNGLEDIFKNRETGFDYVLVTNKWKHCLWQHERNWLLESKSVCTNEVGKFNGEADTIIDFVTQRSDNPFLWLYVTGVKKKCNDFEVGKFKDDLSEYAKYGDTTRKLTSLKEQYWSLSKTAFDLSRNVRGQYSGLYDIFSLRHLWTNSVPERTSEMVFREGLDFKGLGQKAKDFAEKVSNDNWLSTEYKIKSVIVTLEHPDGVVQYRPKDWNKDPNQDVFDFFVGEGRIDDQVFLSRCAIVENGMSEQALKSCCWSKKVDENRPLKLFSGMKFSGGLWEEYKRDHKEKGMSHYDPKPVGSKKVPIPWNVEIRVPHLRSASGAPVESNKFEYNSRAGKWVNSAPPTQVAFLTVSVDGEVVGPTPYERIDACITKAQEMESDNSNVWKKRCRKAEERLEELNKNLSEGGELDAGGQPR